MTARKGVPAFETPRFERVPPHNLEAERSLLACMLLSKEAVTAAMEVVSEEDFYWSAHRRVFAAIASLFIKGEPVDPITVADELERMKALEDVGGKPFLFELVSGVAVTANVEYYANIIVNCSILRKLIEAAARIAALGYEAPKNAVEVLDKAEQIIFEISKAKSKAHPSPLKDVLLETVAYIETLYDVKGSLTGLPSGYVDFDRKTSGLQPSDLIIIAARPSMGKTSFALGIARNVGVIENKPVAIFSLEMSKRQVAQRLICAEARVDASALRLGNLADEDWPRIAKAVDRLSKAPIYIDDSPSPTVMEIRAKARRLKSKCDLALVIVDYLQLMQSSSPYENRQQEISEISRSLKMLGRELDIPVIALSQLSREVEKRADKRPILADLRESGAIEQDADIVAFIYREKVYRRSETPSYDFESYSEEQRASGGGDASWSGGRRRREEDIEPEGDIAEIIIAKHRNGPTGVIKMLFFEKYAKFADLAQVS